MIQSIERAKQPVLFIPGLLGSKLRLDGRPIWADRRTIRHTIHGNPRSLLSPSVEAFDVFRHFSIAPVGIGSFSIKIRISGRPGPLYGRILSQLNRWGASIHTFPYNWTLPIVQIGHELDDWLAIMLRKDWFPRQGWTVIAHSMGGLVLSEYLKHQPRPIGIRRIIILGAPLYGSSRALGVRLGLDEELERLSPNFFFRPVFTEAERENLRAVLMEMPSIYDLMPARPEEPVYSAGLLKTIDRMPEVLERHIGPDSRLLWENAEREIRQRHPQTGLARNLQKLVPRGAELFVLYSSKRDTPYRIAFESSRKNGTQRFVYSDITRGDEVVPLECAISGIDFDEPNTHAKDLGAKHSRLPIGREFQSWIRNTL